MRAALNGRFSNRSYAEHFEIVREGGKKLLSGLFMFGQKPLVLNRICRYRFRWLFARHGEVQMFSA